MPTGFINTAQGAYFVHFLAHSREITDSSLFQEQVDRDWHPLIGPDKGGIGKKGRDRSEAGNAKN
jgi:hypothetical protein